MAKGQNSQPQDTSSIDTDLFVKGMTKDAHDSFVGQENWVHCRNCINNSAKGDAGTIGNEPANLSCITVNYTIIGFINLFGDSWIIYSTDNISSEIGYFDDSRCEYTPLINDQCLNFNKVNLITGAAKENFDCSWQVYWDDGRNPSRTLNLGPADRITENINIPWIQTLVEGPEEEGGQGEPCWVYENADPLQLDCDRIRLAPLMKTPCIKLSKSPSGGLLKNGSYQAFIAYTVNEQQVGDYIGVSNIQPLWEHDDTACSLDIEISNLDTNFEFFKLVILSNNQQQIQGRLVGLYSTRQTSINIDYINEATAKAGSVPFSQLSLRNPAFERSDKMIALNDYLLRIGPTSQYDFNYQPQANDIGARWVSVEYPADYYKKGGNKPTFMRDEQYAFFIRFVYSTGEKSESYHIPGRPKNATDSAVADGNNVIDATETEFWQTHNTAVADEFPPFANPVTDDGGVKIAKGSMGYWESTELYPSTDPNGRWGDLCGTPIRHHKFPDEQTDETVFKSSADNQRIRILGVEFDNITWPRNFDGSLIRNIVGYEILVGSRQGNKSIMAKGLVRNMRNYAIPSDGNSGADNPTLIGTTGLIPNYPFNSADQDPYLVTSDGGTTSWGEGWQSCGNGGSDYATCNNFFTFHSPETSFKRPYLNPYEIKSYGVHIGKQQGHFVTAEKHPKNTIIRDFTAIIAAIIGVGYAINQMRGERIEKLEKSRDLATGQNPMWGQLNPTGTFLPVGFGPIPGAAIFADPTTPFGGAGAMGTPPLPALPLVPTSSPGVVGVAQSAAAATNQTASDALNQASESAFTGSALTTGPGGGEVIYMDTVQATENIAAGLLPGHIGPGRTVEFKGSNYKALPNLMAVATTIFSTLNYVAVGGQEVVDLVINLSSPKPHALKYNSYGLYGREVPMQNGLVFRNRLGKSGYVGNTIQDFGSEFTTDNMRINNLFRPSTVVLQTQGNQVGNPISMNQLINPVDLTYFDTSRQTLSTLSGTFGDGIYGNPTGGYYNSFIAAHYVGLKFNMQNQYGQLDGIKQLPIPCIQCFKDAKDSIDSDVGPSTDSGSAGAEPVDGYESNQNDCVHIYNERGVFMPQEEDTYVTDCLFGGDVYLNRYNEKVIMPFFWQFLSNNEPDEFPFQYQNYQNVPYARHWMDMTKFDMINMISPLLSFSFDWTAGGIPSTLHTLDIPGSDAGDATTEIGSGDWSFGSGSPGAGTQFNFFIHKTAYMYTHSSGINDFFVESELNMGYRDYGGDKKEKHYDWTNYTDIDQLFHVDIIKEGNFYKYDDSLSKSNLNSQMITYGTIQPRDYDPSVADNCFKHYPKRVIYSLQAFQEAKKDFWRVYLPNNYKDFKNAPSTIKPVSKSGALILFPHLAPQLFQGVDTLTTDFETKLSIGDGGLFNEPMQQITTADLPHEYGSCEDSLSAINTPSGVFYISQAQGKIFNYAQQLTNIADAGLKQWFNKYLPSRLLAAYPELEGTDYADNPVFGIGVQSVYDPNYDIVYFSKRDYEPCNPECIEFNEELGLVINETECYGVEQVPDCPEGTEYDPETDECCSFNYYDANYYQDFEAAQTIVVQNPSWEYTIDDFGVPGDWPLIWPPWTISQERFGITSDMWKYEEGPGVSGTDGTPPTSNWMGPLTGNGSHVLAYYARQEPEEYNTYYNDWGDPSTSMAQYWEVCGMLTPDIQPGNWTVGGGYDAELDIEYPEWAAIDGQSFLSLVTNHAGWVEHVSTPMLDTSGNPTDLQPGVIYQGTIALGGPPDTVGYYIISEEGHKDYYTIANITYDLNYEMGIEIWGSQTSCDLGELLWISPAVDGVNGTITDYHGDDDDSTIGAQIGSDEFPIRVNLQPDGPEPYTWNTWASMNGSTEIPYIFRPFGGPWPYLTIRARSNYPNNPQTASTYISVDNFRPPEPVPIFACDCPQGDLFFTGTPFPATPQDCIECEGECVECVERICDPAPYIDVITPVELDNSEFFTDISWTASYDPKIKAWISFHDWHPELVMSSYKHFLTTNTITGLDPTCPPGYTMDEFGMCINDATWECPPGYELDETLNPPQCCKTEYGGDYGEGIPDFTFEYTLIDDGDDMPPFNRMHIENASVTKNENNSIFFEIEDSILKDIRLSKPKRFSITVPFIDNQTLKLPLELVNVHSRDFQVVLETEKGRVKDPYVSKAVSYKVRGEKGLKGSVTFMETKMFGVIRKGQKIYEFTVENSDVKKKASKDKTKYILYDTFNSKRIPIFDCATTDDLKTTVRKASAKQARSSTGGCLKMAVEIDKYTYDAFNVGDEADNLNALADWVTMIIAGVSEVYEDQLDTQVTLNYLRVWTVNDNFSMSFPCGGCEGSGAHKIRTCYLQSLIGEWTTDPDLIAVDRSLVYIFSINDEVLEGGQAWGIGGVCNHDVSSDYCESTPGAYGIAAPLTQNIEFNPEGFLSSDFDSSWSFKVVMHEIGHNLGASHTHSCTAYDPDPDFGFFGGPLDTLNSYVDTYAETYEAWEDGELDENEDPIEAPGCFDPPGNIPPDTANFYSNVQYATIMGYGQWGIGTGDFEFPWEFHPIVIDQRIEPTLQDALDEGCLECTNDDLIIDVVDPGGTTGIGMTALTCECPEGYDMYFIGTWNPAEEIDCLTIFNEQDSTIGVECKIRICEDEFNLAPEIFPSTEASTLWKHNVRCDLFNNYYDVQYPWEIELIESVGQAVNTVRSVEYQMEAFEYKVQLDDEGCALNYGCDDRWHDLMYNFDEAIIYNTEQVSGLLTLVEQTPDVNDIVSYPIIGDNDIQILYSKVEQKFRFDQFWDVTANRNVSESMFITQLNGYIRDLNDAYLDYNKPQLERKKFRHYVNNLVLRKKVEETEGFWIDEFHYQPGEVILHQRKMLLKLVNTKLNLSFR